MGNTDTLYSRTISLRAGLLLTLHLVGLVLLTIGYFTPVWIIIDHTYWNHFYWYGRCYSVGPITHICDWGVWNSLRHVNDYGPVLDLAFILTTSGIVTLYVISGFILVTVFVPLYLNEVYMSFLSIAVSILYPVAAMLVLVASIYVLASFPGWAGYSVILCTVASGIMILAYALLFVNEYVHTRGRQKQRKHTIFSRQAISDMNKNRFVVSTPSPVDSGIPLNLGLESGKPFRKNIEKYLPILICFLTVLGIGIFWLVLFVT